jgi:hypothetical protein
MRNHRFQVAAQAALLLSLASLPARGQTKRDDCIAANRDAQELRRENKLVDAKKKLLACADPSCPAVVNHDCTIWLSEVDGLQPTIVIDAKDSSGQDVSAVQVTVDGHPLAEKLDGTALAVDPGVRVFAFTVAGGPPLTRSLRINEGEKNRRVEIVMSAPGAPPDAPATTLAAPPQVSPLPAAPAGDEVHAQRVVGVVAAGVGVAGIVIGSAFAASTLSEASRQQTDCASAASCANPVQAASDHSAGAMDRAISTVSFIAGGTLIAGGVLLFLTAHAPSAPSPTTGMLAVPALGPGGGGLLLKGSF